MPGLDFFAGAQETALFGLSVRNIAPPAPTTGPSLYPNALGIRQLETAGETTAVSLETCAWFSHTVESLGWEALHCEEPCTTSGTLFGCEVIPPTCIDFSEPRCTATASSAEAWCCDTTFPYCITGILEQDGNTFTAFRCGNDALSGEMEIYDDTTTQVTTTLSESDGPTTVTVVETPTDEPDEEDNSTDDNGNPGSQQEDNEGSTSGGGGGGGGAPVGAIVGGVIGGVALIVGVAFAIWFIRFQRKKQASKAAGSGMEPYRYDPSSGYAGVYPPQGAGYDYSQGGYANNQQQGQYGMGPLPPTFSQAGGSPKPEQQQMQQTGGSMPPVEMPEYSNYGAPSELPSEGTAGRR